MSQWAGAKLMTREKEKRGQVGAGATWEQSMKRRAQLPAYARHPKQENKIIPHQNRAQKCTKKHDSPHGLLPSHGKLLWTHWSHACLLVVALVAAVVPFLLSPPPREFRAAAEEPEPEDKRAFSAAWHLLTWRERRSLGVGLASCAPAARPNHGRTPAHGKWKSDAGKEYTPPRELVAAVLALVRPVAGVWAKRMSAIGTGSMVGLRVPGPA
ncbi:hypothetical protein B0H14DRAFT_3430724 [Mycena olivaceomarginata]|nr:hypothetical protein B0H14DRAFT_3430724 [Mycena olivaceomarginata]